MGIPFVPSAQFNYSTSKDAIVEKLRRASAAARNSNLVMNPVSASAATVVSLSSAPSLTGFTNILGTGGFLGSATITATSGSTVLTGVSSFASVSVGAPIVETTTAYALPTRIPASAVVASFDSVGGTITMDRPAIGSGSFIARFVSQAVSLIGGVPACYGTNLDVWSTETGSSIVRYYPAADIMEFMTDAALFGVGGAQIIYRCLYNGTSAPKYRVAIDDVYLTTDPQTLDITNDGWLTIQLLQAGTHKVRIETQGSFLFSQLNLINGARAWKPAPRPSVGFLGDSWCQGGASGSWGARNIAYVTSALLGVNPVMLSIGGTGYVATQSGNSYAFGDPIRLDATRKVTLDALVFFGSVNDVSSDVTSACLTAWQGARSRNPLIPISIFGVPTTTTTTGGATLAQATTLEGYQKAAFASWGDVNSFYNPLTTRAQVPLIDSTSISTMINADLTHPTDGVGTQMVSRYMASMLAQNWGA